MNEQFRRQQLRFMLYNLLAFTLIFTLFGIILYNQIRDSLYAPVEQSLQESREFIENSPDYIDWQLQFSNALHQNDPEALLELPETFPKPNEDNPGEERLDGAKPGGDRRISDVPMRVQTAIRDADGNILNAYSLGRLYMENYLPDIPFDPVADPSTFFALGGSYCATLVFPKESADGELYYIQLLSSLDGEWSILNHFARLLVVCIIVFVLLSITASYYLSKKSMKPILRAWDRQTEFVGNASHELRTPLAILQNKLESMLTRPSSTIMQETDSIGVLLSETRRLSKLTADLMTLAQADSNTVQLEKTSASLDSLIQEVVEPYMEIAELQGKTLTLSLACPQPILLDRSRIHQLMVILLDNALKYTAEGNSIRLSTSREDGRAVLEVADSGIGIPPEHIDRIFDRFYRADKARSRETGGSGLGLSIAKWIVDMHGGTITARANDTGGTTFRVGIKIQS